MSVVMRAVWRFLSEDGGAELALCTALLYIAGTRACLGRWP